MANIFRSVTVDDLRTEDEKESEKKSKSEKEQKDLPVIPSLRLRFTLWFKC
jgi:hypothetical protein